MKKFLKSLKQHKQKVGETNAVSLFSDGSGTLGVVVGNKLTSDNILCGQPFSDREEMNQFVGYKDALGEQYIKLLRALRHASKVKQCIVNVLINEDGTGVIQGRLYTNIAVFMSIDDAIRKLNNM